MSGGVRRPLPPAPPSHGMALLVVLWTLGLLSVIGISFSFSMRVETSATTHFLQRAQAAALADAAIELGILDLLVSAEDARWRRDGTPYKVPFGGNELRIALISEAGKIDLNVAPDELVHGLLSSVAEEPIAPTIADALLDWRDQDHDRRTQGAEDVDYVAAGRPYGARDSAYLVVEEIDQLLPMSKPVYDRLLPLVTTYSGQPRVDPTTASREVLLAIPGLEPSRVDEFLELRAQSAETGQLPPINLLDEGKVYLGQGRTAVYTVIGEARVAGEVTARRRAVVTLTGDARQPYRVLAYAPSDFQAVARVEDAFDRSLNK